MYVRWNYIEEEMKLKGYSNSKIAKELGISDNSWTRYKKEERDITLKVFCRLLEILDLNFQDVVKDTKLITEEDVAKRNLEQLILNVNYYNKNISNKSDSLDVSDSVKKASENIKNLCEK